MKKNFFRRRSISYRGRGNFATQLSFSQPIVKLAVWLYFIICILVIGTRVFFMTQADHYRDEITALVSEAAGVDVHAGEFSAGFERFWPVITVRQLELARPGGPVSLTLPEVKARLAWSSLWHLEPRFQLLRISSPDLRITRLDKTTLDIAGFVVNLPEGSDEESNFAASGDSRVAAWLLAQKKLELVNGTITYDDRYSPGAAEVRVMNANVVFEQTLLDWRVAVDGTAHISAEESPHKQGECFTAVARIDRHIFTDTSNPLTWKGQAYVRFSHADVAKLLSRAGFPQFISSGSGAAEVWASFADGRITSATADVALLDIHTQLADNLEPLKLAWLESRLYYNGSFGDRAEQTFGVRKLDFMTADRRRLKPTDASVTIRTDSAGQISDGAITVSRLDIGSLIALVPELPLDDAVRSFVTAHAPEGYLKDVSVAFSGNPSDPGNWRPAATFKDLSLKAADGIPGIRAISGSISPLKNGEGFKVVLDSPKSTLSFPGIFRHPDMKFDTLKATAEIVPHPTLTVRLPSFEASNPDAALKGSGSWQATGGPGTLELNGTISRARATAVPYYIPLVVGDDVLDWLEAGILGGSGSNGTFIVKGPLEHFPWDGKHKNDGHFAIEADMTGGRLDFLPSHVRKADRLELARSQQHRRAPRLHRKRLRNPRPERNLARPQGKRRRRQHEVLHGRRSGDHGPRPGRPRPRAPLSQSGQDAQRHPLLRVRRKQRFGRRRRAHEPSYSPFRRHRQKPARQHRCGHPQRHLLLRPQPADGLGRQWEPAHHGKERRHARAPHGHESRRQARQGHRRNEGRRHDARHRCRADDSRTRALPRH